MYLDSKKTKEELKILFFLIKIKKILFSYTKTMTVFRITFFDSKIDDLYLAFNDKKELLKNLKKKYQLDSIKSIEEYAITNWLNNSYVLING